MSQLSLIDKAFFLRKNPLFHSLDMDHILLIADKLEIIHAKKEEPLFFAGDNPTRMYFIVEGSIHVKQDSDQLVLGKEEFFGEEGLFNEAKRTYSAHASKATTLLALSKGHLFSLMSEYPQISINLLKTFFEIFGLRPRKELS